MTNNEYINNLNLNLHISLTLEKLERNGSNRYEKSVTNIASNGA